MLYLDGAPVPVTMFPDKTSQVWHLLVDQYARCYNIEWKFEHEGELMHLAQLYRLLYDFGKKRNAFVEINLHLPYLPYARQDKAVGNTETFALSVFLQIIKDIGFDKVSVFDPHNPPYVRLCLSNVLILTPGLEIQEAMRSVMADIVVFPDEGAQERYKDLLLSGVVVISAMKLRDRSTGKIITTAMPELPPGQSVLMVDDICDGGATFISLAKLMPDREISLYVSHGIFSKGTAILREAGIKRIFTKDGEQFEKA